MGEPLRAIWYDGRVSQPRPVLLRLESHAGGPRLVLHPLAQGAAPHEFSEHEVGWPERWSARREPQRVIIDLRGHGSVEVDDAAAWHDAARKAGVTGSLAEHMQTRWRVFIGVALLAVAGLAAFYQWGTPWAAAQLTRQVPLAWETALAQQALHDLDQALLKPSKLPAARQAELRARFEALTRGLEPAMAPYKDYAPPLSLSFRSGLGPNAFALPGGALVMTDALVETAARGGLGDDALVGVLAHEIGHVVHRHTTRLMVEQAVLNVGLGLALGDVLYLLSVGASALTGLAYRRRHETEADCFAVALMRAVRLPAAPMADLLLAIGDSGARKSGSGVADLLSSHPDSAGRARKLKLGEAQGC